MLPLPATLLSPGSVCSRSAVPPSRPKPTIEARPATFCCTVKPQLVGAVAKVQKKSAVEGGGGGGDPVLNTCPTFAEEAVAVAFAAAATASSAEGEPMSARATVMLASPFAFVYPSVFKSVQAHAPPLPEYEYRFP